jgi:site-specific DNA recombinase
MKDSKGKLALIYSRVSDAKQVRDGDGLNSQITRCREFAKRKG